MFVEAWPTWLIVSLWATWFVFWRRVTPDGTAVARRESVWSRASYLASSPYWAPQRHPEEFPDSWGSCLAALRWGTRFALKSTG
jgi:hypothetical protein